MNIVYWITGLSGAGKTSIGNALYYKLKGKSNNVVFLDGDMMIGVLGETLGYSNEDRKKRARIYSGICKMLQEQGMTVICCSISMFDEIRDWNRENIDGYFEIFLDVSIDTLKKRNQKNLYSRYEKGEIDSLVGLNLDAEFPKNPDLIIKNDGDKSIKECVEEILCHDLKLSDVYGKDTDYWNEFYRKSLSIETPTKFAQFIMPSLKKGGRLLELGCGNGRDSIYFQTNGLYVTAVDASKNAIELISEKNSGIIAVCDDFIKAPGIFQQQYDYCYSRFSIHSINEKQQNVLIKNVYAALKKGGQFFIEVRSVNDTIYGKGQEVEKNAFIYEAHYRRFIVLDELVRELCECEFEVAYSAEDTGFAPYKEDDPPIIRIIASKC